MLCLKPKEKEPAIFVRLVRDLEKRETADCLNKRKCKSFCVKTFRKTLGRIGPSPDTGHTF